MEKTRGYTGGLWSEQAQVKHGGGAIKQDEVTETHRVNAHRTQVSTEKRAENKTGNRRNTCLKMF